MDHIQIAAQNNRLAGELQLPDVPKEVPVPLIDSVVQPFKAQLSVWGVNSDHVELGILQCSHSTLLGVFFNANVVRHFEWLHPS